MKKILFAAFMIMASAVGVEAQQTEIELDTSMIEIVGPAYPRYMIEMPQISDFDEFWTGHLNLFNAIDNTDIVADCVFTGFRFVTGSPRIIYGVATSFILSNYLMENGENLWYQYRTTVDGKLVFEETDVTMREFMDTLFVAMVVQKDGNGYTRLDSVPYHRCMTKRFFDVGLVGTNSQHYYVGMVEFYFEHPVEVHDTFYVGMVSKQHRTGHINVLHIGDIRRATTGGIVFPEIPPRWLAIDKNESAVLTWATQRPFSGNSALPILFPIVSPMEVDSVDHSRVRGLAVGRSRYNQPKLEWEDDYLQTGYEIELVEKELPFDSVGRIATEHGPYVLGMVNDSTKYYKARVRAMYHPCCEAYTHAELTGPWSDSVVFYTGVYAPGTTFDDTNAIAIPEGEGQGFFTLTPNPARGEVTVAVGGAWTEGGGQWTAVLTDASGREVLRKTLVAGPAKFTLQLKGFAAGVYYVTLANTAHSATRRLVVGE